MNIDRNEILAVYRRTHEEMSYQLVCQRLAIEKLEAHIRDLQAKIDELESDSSEDTK